ncbi:MAG: VWA domain-containing protein [Kofleriaceae bacterium]
MTALLMVRAERARGRAIRRLAAAGPETSVASARRWFRDGLSLAGVALACIALARPQSGYRWEATPQRGIDLMFAVDTSKSMRAADLAPDRLTRAKLAVADLVRTFDTARVGLIAFAGDAFVQAPMTADRAVFLEALDALDVDTIPTPGTDLASAIRAASQAMKSEPDHAKVLVLLSDGEDLAGSALDAARAAGKDGLVIYTVGVGSRQGALIEIPDGKGGKELVRDEAGQPVHSHLDETMLASIARTTGGEYRALGADGRGLDQLYAIARARLPQQTTAGTQHKVYAERFQVPLALAIGCLLVGLAIGDRRRMVRRGRGRVVGIGALLVVLAVPAIASAEPLAAGVTAYTKRDFTAAQQQFEAALHTPDVARQHDAYYDLGDARYRAGEATAAKDRAATIATWKQALESYDAAIALAPLDGHARFNRNFVAIKLAQLEQQQKQDQKKQDQNQQAQNQSQNQNGAGKQGQNQQAQNQNGSGKPDQKPGQGKQDQQAQNQNGSGKPDQNHKPGQDKQDQGKQAQNQQAQDQHGKPDQNQAGKQDQQAQTQNGSGDQPASKQANNQQPSAPDASDHAGHAAGAVGSSESPQQAAARAATAVADAKRSDAGQLTSAEALQLLNSVEDELRPMPIHGRSDARPRPTPTKDW